MKYNINKGIHKCDLNEESTTSFFLLMPRGSFKYSYINLTLYFHNQKSYFSINNRNILYVHIFFWWIREMVEKGVETLESKES